jgi:hypothetical protein
MSTPRLSQRGQAQRPVMYVRIVCVILMNKEAMVKTSERQKKKERTSIRVCFQL